MLRPGRDRVRRLTCRGVASPPRMEHGSVFPLPPELPAEQRRFPPRLGTDDREGDTP
jgi:hypothetical protein